MATIDEKRLKNAAALVENGIHLWNRDREKAIGLLMRAYHNGLLLWERTGWDEAYNVAYDAEKMIRDGCPSPAVRKAAQTLAKGKGTSKARSEAGRRLAKRRKRNPDAKAVLRKAMRGT